MMLDLFKGTPYNVYVKYYMLSIEDNKYLKGLNRVQKCGPTIQYDLAVLVPLVTSIRAVFFFET